MGDRDYRSVIRNALDSIGRELQTKIDASDTSTIHLEEAVQCLRRSYYNRTDPLDENRHGFSELLAGLLGKIGYAPGEKSFDIGGGMTVRGAAQMISDDTVILFRPAAEMPNNPHSADLLYLNACMWIYDKPDGVVVYVTGDRQETSFSLTRNKPMFEETVRRVRVLADLIVGDRAPILEPSAECDQCQYYERCYTRKKMSNQITLASMLGLGKGPD